MLWTERLAIRRITSALGGPTLTQHSDSQGRLKSALAEAARLTDGALDALLPKPAGHHARVQEAMRC